jgi:cell division septum initiation protein DivIVA
MSVEEVRKAVQMLRSVELRRAVRGVDPEQARKLLDEAADLLAAAGREQSELRGEVERLREANDEGAVGKALVAATRAGEALMAEAREAAASLGAEAEAQAAALLEQVTAEAEKREQETATARERFEQELTDARKAHANELESARVDADAALAAARRELSHLEKQAAQLRSLVTDLERRIVEIAQGALEELEAFGSSPSTTPGSDLLVDLRPAAAPSDVAASRSAPAAARSEDQPKRR